ncbi:MAG: DUF3108 domain-containing protein [Helicobacteraceae bacterium]|jgi:hypothetical protein|nr:DUF3108 domain-containing protein [Helicobacteraceae bacterium]
MRAILISVFVGVFASAFESVAIYDVSYSFFTLGEAQAMLKIDGDSYVTSVSAKAGGLVGVFSNNRQESYMSEGKVLGEKLIPQKFEFKSSAGDKKTYMGVFFDHDNAQATIMREQCDEDKCEYETIMAQDENYTTEDILTLYHNVTHNFIKSGQKQITVKAFGSRKSVKIELPEGKRLETAKELFDDRGGHYLVVLLNQKIFTSNEGELYVRLDDDNIATEAVLKDTLLFGDIVGKLREKRVTP